MWTPRRIFLLLTGLVLCGAVYYTYALVLGGIDGLPPLPQKYSKVQSNIAPATANGGPKEEKPSDVRIQQAFGPKCPEMNYKIKFESRVKGLLVAAGNMNATREDGRVELTRVSLAMFGKTLTPDGFPEINVIHCDRCYLEFDKPIRKLSDNMDFSRLVSAELVSDPELPDFDARKGFVRVRNNRRTGDMLDDLELKTVGPVFYLSEPKPADPGGPMPPNIRTSAPVEVTDGQNLPLPDAKGIQTIVPTITANGMNIWLQQEEAKTVAVAGKPAPAPKKKAGSYSGVDRIEFLSDVVMNHFSDGGSGFPTPGLQADKKPEVKGPLPKGTVAVVPDRKQIQIRTPGTFVYRASEDVANFRRADEAPVGQPNHVVVTRQGKDAGLDSLTSDFLDVHFNRKQKTVSLRRNPGVSAAVGVANAAKPSGGQDMDIDRVHAWGENLVLSSDSDSLSAWGNDLVYDKAAGTTLLTGQPKMLAIKDGNQIEAVSLLMINMDDKTKQQAIAKGPGTIGMGEKDPKTASYNRQAHWSDTLTFSKVREGGKDLDLLVLKGDAKFVDVVGDQNLTAQQIRLWMLREEAAPGKPATPVAVAKNDDKPKPLEPARVQVAGKPPEKGGEKTGEKQPKPHRLEAVGAVTAHSADMDVRKTEYLNVSFRYAPAKVGPPAPKGNLTAKAPFPAPGIAPGPEVKTIVLAPVDPPKLPVVPMGNPGLSGLLVSDRKPEMPLPGPVGPMNPTIAGGKPAPAPKPPTNLSAKRIETWVVVTDGKNELEKAHCEEDVIVYQKPTEENPNGISLTGRELELTHFADGDLLIVKGSDQQLGSVLFNKVSLIGDDIRIDERHNFVIVKGVGSMRLLSSTDLQGDKLQEPRYVTITWRDQMEFYGSDRRATFEGGVQARQDSFDVLCENMQVTMDREVVFSRFRKVPEAPAPVVAPKPPTPATPGAQTVALAPAPALTKEQKETPKIDSLFCDQVPREGKPRPKVLQPVSITEKIIDRNEKLVKYQLIEAREIEGDNLRETMTGHGPGLVRLFQKGASDPLGNANAVPVANGKAPKEEMKLTRVEYRERMLADKKARKTIFLGDIEVVHLPADNPDIDIDTNKIPEGGFFLKCSNRLEMYTTTGRNRKNLPVQYQNMLAQGSVTMRGTDFAGTASEITYEEEKETILLKGTRESPAVLQKFEVPGGKPKELIAVRIRYNPRTKDYTLEEALGIRAQ